MERVEKDPFFFKQYYHNVKDRCSFHKMSSTHIQSDMRVLEAGGGKRSVTRECGLQTKSVLGIDLCSEDLKSNQALDFRVVGDLAHLPLRNEIYDCIVCRNVVEHLKNPLQVFGEFQRVLRRGGLVLIRTPNMYNPFMFLSAILPLKMRIWIKRKLLHDLEGDTFPTYYKCNRVRMMIRTFERLDMELVAIHRDGLLAYFNFSSLLVTLITVYEKITDIFFLRWLKMWIIISFKKAATDQK